MLLCPLTPTVGGRSYNTSTRRMASTPVCASPIVQILWASVVPMFEQFLTDIKSVLIFRVRGWRWGFAGDLRVSPHWVSSHLTTLYWPLSLKWRQSHQASAGRRHVWRWPKRRAGTRGSWEMCRRKRRSSKNRVEEKMEGCRRSVLWSRSARLVGVESYEGKVGGSRDTVKMRLTHLPNSQSSSSYNHCQEVWITNLNLNRTKKKILYSVTSPRRNHEFALLIIKSDPASFPEQSSLVHGIKGYLRCPWTQSVLHYLPGWLHYFSHLDEIPFCESDKVTPWAPVIFLLRKYHVELFHSWKNWNALTTYLLIFCKLWTKKKVHCHCQHETNVSLHMTRADKISTPSPLEFSLGHALQTFVFTFCCAEPV